MAVNLSGKPLTSPLHYFKREMFVTLKLLIEKKLQFQNVQKVLVAIKKKNMKHHTDTNKKNFFLKIQLVSF